MARSKTARRRGTLLPPVSRLPRTSSPPPRLPSSAHMDGIAQQLASRVSEELPAILYQLAQQGFNPEDQPLRLSCHLTPAEHAQYDDGNGNQVQVASVDLGRDFTPISSAGTSQRFGLGDSLTPNFSDLNVPDMNDDTAFSLAWDRSTWPAHNSPHLQPADEGRPRKRQKQVTPSSTSSDRPSTATSMIRVGDTERRVTHKKRASESPALQPSSLDKLINGIWDSLFSGIRMDPTEIIEQWQAIESGGQPKLLTDNEQDLTTERGSGAFGRMNNLTRKISRTMRACRSLEVIVQAHWIQCFDDRVAELAEMYTREKAKRDALSEACADFSWTEKELRNKMAIWRGYHDIKKAAGWAALVFSGMGLYRFCKYRVSFTEETYRILRALRHRVEVAADTLHPRWRTLLGIVEASTERRYHGHHHDWVVNGPGNEAIHLPQTYSQWDRNFSYTHLARSEINSEVWGEFDPRVVDSVKGDGFNCHFCGARQSDNAVENNCQCYPNLYGSPKSTIAAVQVYRTPNGKNNGLLACCAFEKGWAVGEFVGEVTTGISGLDVMVDRTDRASYQIWQGRKGNHTRFVNHSCEPNSHYERFVWLGKQRTVLVSNGIDAGEEVTVDYGVTYWEDLDKECLCETSNCRYKRRHKVQQLVTPPNGDA